MPTSTSSSKWRTRMPTSQRCSTYLLTSPNTRPAGAAKAAPVLLARHRPVTAVNPISGGAMKPTLYDTLIGAVWRHFTSLILFSCLINVLLLVSTIYMLQVYDRVLSTG